MNIGSKIKSSFEKSDFTGMFQKFGGAMYTPVAIYAFMGIVVAISSLCRNPLVFGGLADSSTFWYKVWTVIYNGGWVAFSNMELMFVIGIPIGLAKKEHGRAALESLVIYLIFCRFVSTFLELFGSSFITDYSLEAGGTSGLKMIAGMKTLDTGIIGAIAIALVAVYLHNRFYDKKLPDFLGTFQGITFVSIMGFITMIPVSLITCFAWPMIQNGIGSIQTFLVSTGFVGIFLYTFLERFLIPLGLHHFIYQPFYFGPAVVAEGINAYWLEHLNEFAASTESLTTLFPQGGFSLNGNIKVFGIIGVALAFYFTSKPDKRKKTLAIVIPTAIASILSGITEPFEFTFLFIAPMLFLVYSLLGALMAVIMNAFGVSGDMFGGLITMLTKNHIPLWKNHWPTYLVHFAIGAIFIVIFFFIFRFLILKYDFKTPGREIDDSASPKLFTKKDYQESKKNNPFQYKAILYLESIGGKDNIETLANCATRLRIMVKSTDKVKSDTEIKAIGAHGVVRKGRMIQIIVGLDAPNVKGEMEKAIQDET